MKTYNGFPTIPIPKFLQGKGWRVLSESEFDNPMALSAHTLPGGGSVGVWVNFPDLRDQEESGKEFGLRYYVEVAREDDELISYNGLRLFAGDSESAVRHLLDALFDPSNRRTKPWY